jgi:hypothetical protein
MQAFFDLTTERYTFDSPIPWSCIRFYAREHAYEDEEIEYFHALIKQMDDAYVAHVREKFKPGKPGMRDKDHGKPSLRGNAKRPR